MRIPRRVDRALLTNWHQWITVALKRFAASGYGEAARAMTMETAGDLIASPDVFYSGAVGGETPESPRGLIIMTHARWEEGVIGQAVAKVPLFAADSYDIAVTLAQSALLAAGESNAALVSFAAGHAPTFIHVAATDAGFHVGSQAMTVRADLAAIAPAVAKIPLRGRFRPATGADADAVAMIAEVGLPRARYTSDPHFPAALGGRLYAAWARNLVSGAADMVMLAEQGSDVIGFVSMCMDPNRRSQVPDLMAVAPKYDGFGVGVMLVRHMLEWYREHGMKVLIGGTEKNNVAINSLYARLGFQFLDANLVYHASPAWNPLRDRLQSARRLVRQEETSTKGK